MKAGSASSLFRTSSIEPQEIQLDIYRFSIYQPPVRILDAREEDMIIRSLKRCSAPRRLQVCRPRMLHAKRRSYSTSTSSIATAGAPASPASMLGAFTNEFDKIAPKFEVHGSQIDVLRSPAEFYETLKVGILQSER